MPTTEVATENNEQATATEIADGLSSCQRMILPIFCQAEFDNYYRPVNVMCFSSFQCSE